MTTGLPPFSAASISDLAGSMPPITSTTMSTSGRVTSACASAVSSARSIPAARRCPTRRTAIPASSSRAPTRRARSSACSVSSRATSDPTTPQPSRATLQASGDGSRLAEVTRRPGEQVVQGLRGGRSVRAAPARDRDHGRARRRGCSCWPATGSRRRWRRTASRSPGARSDGRYACRTTMSPLSQCLPTTRDSIGGAADGAGGQRAQRRRRRTARS